jgi:hypothetical protein
MAYINIIIKEHSQNPQRGEQQEITKHQKEKAAVS